MQKFSRRRFLRGAFVLGTGGILIPTMLQDSSFPAASSIKASTNDYDVIVIGAGVSGLAAARVIQAAKLNVLILEARDRIGGRTFTDSIAGTPVDLGASWIHGIKNNPVYKLTRSFGIKTAFTDYDSTKIYSSDGSILPSPDSVDSFADSLTRLQDNLRSVRDENGSPDISLAEDFNTIVENSTFSDQQKKQIDFILNTYIEHEYAADVADLSSIYWDQGSDFGSQDVLFPNGYKQLISKLATKIKRKLSHVVTKIDYRGSSVVVSTNKGDFSASKVLLTLPIGVLKSGAVTFTPELPLDKLNAINLLGSGLLNKTYLRFSRVFWPTDVHLLNYISSEKGQWCEWINMHKYLKKPVLLGFNAGAFASQLENLSDADTVASAMQTLRTIYGTSVPDPVSTIVTRWGKDPFSLGSYSYLGVGATPSSYDKLAAPVENKLFFAGEATNKQYAASVHGAYLSGLREASRIIRS